MVFGVGFYSYTIGNVQTIINEIDVREYNLRIKLDTLLEFSKRNEKMPPDLMKDIQSYIQNNSFNEEVIPVHIQEILEALPMPLKGEVAKQAFKELTDGIVFFHDKPSDFLWHLLPKLRQMNFFAGEYLYFENDSPEEIFFI